MLLRRVLVVARPPRIKILFRFKYRSTVHRSMVVLNTLDRDLDIAFAPVVGTAWELVGVPAVGSIAPEPAGYHALLPVVFEMGRT